MAADQKSGDAKASANVKTPANAKPKATRTAPPLSPSQALEPKRAPSRPAQSRRIRSGRPEPRIVRALSSILTMTLLVVGLVGGLGFMLHASYEGPGPLESTRSFIIAKGEGRVDIAARLEREGIISNRWIFTAGQLLQATLGTRKSADLKAGSYEMKKSASMREVVDTLVEGRSVAAKLTVPEGLTSQQIVERIKADPNLTGEVSVIPAEGTLLPDTYVYTRGLSRQELIDRMQAEHAKVLASAWEKRQQGLPLLTPQDALIMASIIEKETGRNDERERVAAVFVNRMRKPMRLQSDPTIVYGISGGQGPLGRPITRSDIDTKTAYNTYQIDGLPPTPICNPGRQAIEATLNPAKTNEIYFVADGTGGHTFSETLRDHNAAVANWRRLEREAKAAKEAQAALGTTTPVAKVGKGGGAAPVAAVAPAPEAVPVMGSADPVAGAAAPAAAAPEQAAVTNASAIPLPVRKPKR
jgi:UPF0755 protein